MFSSLWQNLTGGYDGTNDDEHHFSRPYISEEDKQAALLLSSFPPYGSHAAKRHLAAVNYTTSTAIPASTEIAASSPHRPNNKRRVRKSATGGGGGGAQEFENDVDYEDYVGMMKKQDGYDDFDDNASVGSFRYRYGVSAGFDGDGSVNKNKEKSKLKEIVQSNAQDFWDNDDELALWSNSEHQVDKCLNDTKNDIYRNNTNYPATHQINDNNILNGNHYPSKMIILDNNQRKDSEFTYSSQEETCNESYSSNDDDASYNSLNRLHVRRGSASSNIKTSSTVLPTMHNYDEKKHWMPDQLCKHCYACEATFTVFRRRHHCRLCGQVFCSRCSSFFLEIEGDKLAGVEYDSFDNSNSSMHDLQYRQNNVVRTIRACKLCYDQVSASGPNGLTWFTTKGESDGVSSHTNPLPQTETIISPLKGLHGGVLSSSHFHPSPLPTEVVSPSTMTSFQGVEPSVDFENLSIVKQKLEADRQKREEEEKAAELSEKTSVTDNHNDHSRTNLNVAMIGKTITSFRRFGRLAESAAREAQIGGVGFNDEETKLVGTGVKESEEKPNNETNDEKKSTVAKPPSPENETNVHDPSKSITMPHKDIVVTDVIKEAHRQLGITAANHLEKMCRELLRSECPSLIIEKDMNEENNKNFNLWVDKLMMLATRCCASLKPNVKNGDFLDIRPYCKLKSIPGGSIDDSAYISGVMFHKNVSHKKMSQDILDPQIMLLSGGIEYSRTENRITSLGTLLKQEGQYMEILVNKIANLNPDVLMVGRSVSRKAQELLLERGIRLVQHVKSDIMERIARQTGASILSSTDHVMNQFGKSVLGKCKRFRLVVFRDNEIWLNNKMTSRQQKTTQPESAFFYPSHDIDYLLKKTGLPNHKRQAALAAEVLGEKVYNGGDAVKKGIAKRGVALTYVMIEGCPADLGCTIVLRGASKKSLKEVKRVLHFLVNAAYNLRLETSYYRNIRARLPPDFQLASGISMSSSLCVDYGSPPFGKKIRPWNGVEGNNNQINKSISSPISALDHQSILISSVWMSGKTQCCPAEVKGITYYSAQDVSLGQFLRDSCFNRSLKCRNVTCEKSILEHALTFIHNDGLIEVTVEEMQDPILPLPTSSKENRRVELDGKVYPNIEIATWSHCQKCGQVVTPLTYIDEDTWNYSFGKFLEVSFYNNTMIFNAPERGCSCSVQNESTLFFGHNNLAARFAYKRIRPYGVYLRRFMPFDDYFHVMVTLNDLDRIFVASSELFVKFEKHINSITKGTRQLFGYSSSRPEHIQTILSELLCMYFEVQKAANILPDKIAFVKNQYESKDEACIYNELKNSSYDDFIHFPWRCRRHVYMLTSSWNERLSTIGQALAAMKKAAASSTQPSSNKEAQATVAECIDEVVEVLQRLVKLKEKVNSKQLSDLSLHSMDKEWSKQQSNPNRQSRAVSDSKDASETDEYATGNNNQNRNQFFDFSEQIDADVLASRQRYAKQMDVSNSKNRSRRNSEPNLRSESPSQSRKSGTAGVVKSALTRFFNRTSKEENEYVVDLEMLGEGRLQLEPGVDGIVIPVYDDQPSTVVAYSLSSSYYHSQFRSYSKNDASDAHRRYHKMDESVRDDTHISSTGIEESSRTKNESMKRGKSYSRNNQLPPSVNIPLDDKKSIERRMLARNKSHIKHTFREDDEKGNPSAKFVCTTYWSTQFQAVRQAFMKEENSLLSANDVERNYIRSLSTSLSWAASGGKSGASFSKTADDRFIIKSVSRVELQMFLDCAPAYFEYLSKSFFHGLPTMLCKILGVYQIGYHNYITGKRSMEQVAVMQNIFYGRKISRVFDLKGSLRGRFAKNNNFKDKLVLETDSKPLNDQDKVKDRESNSADTSSDDDSSSNSSTSSKEYNSQSTPDSTSDDERDKRVNKQTEKNSEKNVDSDEKKFPNPPTPANNNQDSSSLPPTFLDGDFLEFTSGRPLPMSDRAKAIFHMSILNDTLFLSIINVLDYSILVGIDEEQKELVVGIIDFMRQYDILKQMERVGKSIPMVVGGAEAPTIIQPPLYKARFISSMERYFMTVPTKWTNT